MFSCGTDDDPLVREEIFGPVVTLLTFDTVDEVISRCNNSEYGLAAGVVTKDTKLAKEIAGRFEAGNVWINGAYNYAVPEMPFGGVKRSGFGREGGEGAVKDWTYLKTVWCDDLEDE